LFGRCRDGSSSFSGIEIFFSPQRIILVYDTGGIMTRKEWVASSYYGLMIPKEEEEAND
jgi:hypothetical protein